MSAPYIPLGDDWHVSEVTPWFPGSVKPVRRGVYQRRYPIGVFHSRWDGVRWYAGAFRADDAAALSLISEERNLRWRGLAQDPKGKP